MIIFILFFLSIQLSIQFRVTHAQDVECKRQNGRISIPLKAKPIQFCRTRHLLHPGVLLRKPTQSKDYSASTITRSIVSSNSNALHAFTNPTPLVETSETGIDTAFPTTRSNNEPTFTASPDVKPVSNVQHVSQSPTVTPLPPTKGVQITSDSSWTYLDNNRIKVGISKENGAAIGWLSYRDSSGSESPNLVNTWDKGRFIQASYYGRKDGSTWNGDQWRFNPVQAGSWENQKSNVNYVKLINDRTVKTSVTPRNWAGQELLKNCLIEATISLSNAYVKIHYKLTYNGTEEHPPYHQELPAVFLDRSFDTLVYYNGSRAWTQDSLSYDKPQGTESPSKGRLPEKWVAYLNSQTKQAVGIYSPNSEQFTAYRVGPDGSQAKSDCSYVAPVGTYAIVPNQKLEHEVYIVVGDLESIRKTIYSVARK